MTTHGDMEQFAILNQTYPHLAESVGSEDLDGGGVLVLPGDDGLAADDHHQRLAVVLQRVRLVLEANSIDI